MYKKVSGGGGYIAHNVFQIKFWNGILNENPNITAWDDQNYTTNGVVFTGTTLYPHPLLCAVDSISNKNIYGWWNNNMISGGSNPNYLKGNSNYLLFDSYNLQQFFDLILFLPPDLNSNIDFMLEIRYNGTVNMVTLHYNINTENQPIWKYCKKNKMIYFCGINSNETILAKSTLMPYLKKAENIYIEI